MRTEVLWELLTRGAFVAVYEDLYEAFNSGTVESRDETDMQRLLEELDEAARDNYDMETAQDVCDDYHVSERDE